MSKYSSTLGARFKNICFVGLNRVEFFPEGSDESIFADRWVDVTDEQSRRNLGLVFFAPRELDGEPIDPYMLLTDEEDEGETKEPADIRQAFQGVSLLDFCRLAPAEPNRLNILVTADVIFHWDMNDNYIQPTSALTWIRDLKLILKGYPKSTEKYIYTNWSSPKLDELEVVIHPVRELPLDSNSWINMPTFQEKFGGAVLTLSIIISCLAYGILFIQSQQLNNLRTDIKHLQSATPKRANSDQLEALMDEQEAYMAYRDIMPLAIKDVGMAIQKSGMKIADFEIKSVNPQIPPKEYLVTIKSQIGAYKGWLQEEPVAKSVLAESMMISAIRKPPGGNQLVLEGLIELSPISEIVDTYIKENLPDTEINNIIPNTARGGERS